MGSKTIHASRILTESGWLENGLITLNEQGKIESIVAAKIPCPNNLIVMPALIDTHIHGAMGSDVMDATHEALNTMSQFLASRGVGAFLATTVTESDAHTEAALEQVKKSYRQGLDGAELLGSYLEGPFFTAKNKGAHPEALLKAPDQALIEKWMAIAQDSLKCIALAPEYPNALDMIAWLKNKGLRVMLAHTDASYETTKAALQAGADGVVHCYNGMSGLHHRMPGVVGAAFTVPNCCTEIIVDGHHVHFAAVNVALRCCGKNLILISDAMRATGMPDGDYYLGELLVHMQGGIVKTDSGSLAGSTLTLNTAVNNLAEAGEISFAEAWLHGSHYPARSLGLDHKLGSIAPNKQANLVLLTPDHQLTATIVKGKIVFNSTHLPEGVCI
ncbi:N-acetylglucosamine-6-phosphate deacetylase [Zophobihabitans entericus]|uniref:N-acetylglucosamine-6-phosphate deacetylase n=1 Tax=Zophobihabitans entericus TaxID=1635327 RepID=A0A6G9IF18_9GAMM|nr:N-acetylglucosamine-6-phosphate deacetylase [Zophobihabitans entericus]